MQLIYDGDGNIVKRIIRTKTELITQVPTVDGGWWNISIERIAR